METVLVPFPFSFDRLAFVARIRRSRNTGGSCLGLPHYALLIRATKSDQISINLFIATCQN